MNESFIRESIERRHTVYIRCMRRVTWHPVSVTSLHTDQSKSGWCNLSTDPRVGDVIYFLDRLHHPRLDWSVCKFQACDRYRMSRYSPHTSDVQYAYVRYSLLYHILLVVSVHGSMCEHGSWLSSEQSRNWHAETCENSKCMRHALCMD